MLCWMTYPLGMPESDSDKWKKLVWDIRRPSMPCLYGHTWSVFWNHFLLLCWWHFRDLYSSHFSLRTNDTVDSGQPGYHWRGLSFNWPLQMLEETSVRGQNVEAAEGTSMSCVCPWTSDVSNLKQNHEEELEKCLWGCNLGLSPGCHMHFIEYFHCLEN